MRCDLDAEDGFPEWLIPQFDGFLQLDHFNFHPIARHQQLTQLAVQSKIDLLCSELPHGQDIFLPISPG